MQILFSTHSENKFLFHAVFAWMFAISILFQSTFLYFQANTIVNRAEAAAFSENFSTTDYKDYVYSYNDTWGVSAPVGMTPQIQTAHQHAVGSYPTYVTPGDFNEDTYPDLATSNRNSNNVSVIINNTSGGFSAATNYTVGSQPQSIYTTDFNHDSHLDLVTVSGGSTVSVLLGNGTGTFATAVNYPIGSGCSFFLVTDLNNDTYDDVATADRSSGTVSVLLNQGNGTFGSTATYVTGSVPFIIVGAKLNNDNFVDLVVTNTYSDTVSVLLSQGSGIFQAPVDYGVDSRPRGVITADFNKDGHLDIAVAAQESYYVDVLLNQGGGTFTASARYASPGAPFTLRSMDINEDTYPDIVTANIDGGGPDILMNDGDGTFTPADSLVSGGTPLDVLPVDFDQDGHMDLVVTNYGSNTLALFIHNGVNGLNPTPVLFQVGTSPRYSIVADFNKDGIQDIAANNIGSNNVSLIYSEGSVFQSIYFQYPQTEGHASVAGSTNISSENVGSIGINPVVATPAGTRIEYKVSLDRGVNWCLLPAYSDETHAPTSVIFINTEGQCNVAGRLSDVEDLVTVTPSGSVLYLLELYTADAHQTPSVEQLSFASVDGSIPTITNMRDIVSSHTMNDVDVTHSFFFTLPFTRNGPLYLRFPNNFTITGAPTDGSACLSGFDYSTHYMSATMTDCVGAITITGGTTTNPSVGGSYSIVVDDGVRPGTLAIAINDSDSVTMFASIAPSFTFDLAINDSATYSDTNAPHTIDFGSLSPATVTHSGTLPTPAFVNMKVDSNTNLGAAIIIRGIGSNPSGLHSTVANYTIATSAGTQETLSAGVEGYGFAVINTAALSLNLPISAYPFDSYSEGTVGGVNDISRTLATISSGDIINAATVSVEASVSISASTPAANDYTHQTRFVATGTF